MARGGAAPQLPQPGPHERCDPCPRPADLTLQLLAVREQSGRPDPGLQQLVRRRLRLLESDSREVARALGVSRGRRGLGVSVGGAGAQRQGWDGVGSLGLCGPSFQAARWGLELHGTGGRVGEKTQGKQEAGKGSGLGCAGAEPGATAVGPGPRQNHLLP